MMISELSFPHLQRANEERMTRELEHRRVVNERLEEERSVAAAGRHEGRAHPSRRMSWHARRAIGSRSDGPHPAI